jgi:hypothetical protein
VLNRENVLLTTECAFRDCTFRYEEMEMRADGSSFLLRFPAAAGLTYRFAATLQSGASFLRLAVFAPESIGSASDPGGASQSSCRLPLASTDGAVSNDVAEIPLGTWGQNGQTWGDLHGCEDKTRVGPPEQRDGCDGEYRHFPGQSFPDTGDWEWTAAFTGVYILKVSSNCDIPYYDDTALCQTTADGVECPDDSMEQCSSAVRLTITTVDRSVHVKHNITVPVRQEVLDSPELQAQMADMFMARQQPALVFPTAISKLNCGLPENFAVCATLPPSSAGGGHRRAQGDDTHTCPHLVFVTRDAAMRRECSLSDSDPTDARLEGSCPSLACARALLPLLSDCDESIAELAGHLGTEHEFYQALIQSELSSSCGELDAGAAMFASVRVEFRAPSRAVADQLILEHEAMAAVMFPPIEPTSGLCFGGGGALGVAVPCDGRRRQLRDGEAAGEPGRQQLQCGPSCREKDDQIHRLTEQLRQQQAAAADAAAENLQLLEASAAENRRLKHNIRTQASTIALQKLLRRPAPAAWPTKYLASPAAETQPPPRDRRRVQQSGSVALSTHEATDGTVKACAVHPCELGGGLPTNCLNGGVCVEAEGTGAVKPFTCQCAGRFAGGRCSGCKYGYSGPLCGQIELNDGAALLAFKKSGNGDSVLDSWMEGSDPCAAGAPWAAVACVDGRVAQLFFHNSEACPPACTLYESLPAGFVLTGELAKLVPLTELSNLYLWGMDVRGDLSVLAVLPLQHLAIGGSAVVGKLSDFAGMPLTDLNVASDAVTGDLSDLAGMQITYLELQCPRVTGNAGIDLSTMPLVHAGLAITHVTGCMDFCKTGFAVADSQGNRRQSCNCPCTDRTGDGC